MDSKRTSTRPKPSTSTTTTSASTSTARKSTAVKPSTTPQPARSTTTPTPTPSATAKKPGPTATTSTTAKKSSTARVSTPVPASAKSAAASKKVVTETVMADASTDTLDLETETAAAVGESGKEVLDNGADADESPTQTIARLSAQLAALSESESTLKDALDARDIEFYMLRSEYDTHLASAESKQSSFASELNSESVFDTLQAENQALQRRISAMKREMDEAVDAVKMEMSSKESDLQNELQTSLGARDTEIATLQSNNAAQTAQLQSLLQELTQLKESNHAKDFELARSARDYLALQQQISRASMVEAAKLDELDFARESLESARARIRELEGHLESSLNELKQVRLDLLAFAKAEQVEVAEATKSSANADAELIQQLQQLQDARQKDAENLALLEARVVGLSLERDSLIAEVETVKSEFSKPVEATIKESNEQELENVKRLENLVVELTQERDTLAAQIELKTSEAREANDRAITAEESLVTAQVSTKDVSASSDSAELQAEIEALRKQSEEDKETALQAALFSFESEKAVLLAEISELKAKHEQSVADLQQSLESIASAKISSAAADDSTGSVDVGALQSRLDAMQSELMSAQDESTLQMTQFTQEKAVLLQQIDNLTAELTKISTNSEQQTSMLKETLIAQFESDRNVAIAAAVAEIEYEKANLEEKVCKLEATHLQERTTLDTLQTGDIDELAKRATAAESRVEALMAERAELLAAAEERAQSQRAEHGDSQQLSLLQNEINALRTAHEAEIAALKSQTPTSVTETPVVSSSHITTLESNLQQVTLDAESAKQRVSHLEHLHAQIMNQFETTQSESQDLKTALYKKVSQITDMESRIEILSSDLEDARMQLASLSSTHTQLVEQHGDLQTSHIDQDIAAMSLADQELAAAKQELQAAVIQTEQLGSQLQTANEKLLNESARVATLQRQLDLMASVNKTDRSDSFMATRRLALDPTISVEKRLLAFEKLVAEMEVQLVAKARSPPLSPGILRSPVPSVGQLRIVNDEDD
ncbi:hypothetical protein HDU77_010425 [Chytriomyces hyalinus]|nr:hypothetical protein HDU77_010425 [Chytriomyces hyalinus]